MEKDATGRRVTLSKTLHWPEMGHARDTFQSSTLLNRFDEHRFFAYVNITLL